MNTNKKLSRMKKNIGLLSLLIVASFFNAKAQNAEQMIKDWERAKAYTRDYLRCHA